MKDDRIRVPVDAAYLMSLGTAAYCFASLEWNAVYCGEKLSPGYVSKVAKKTAGMIADDIVGFSHLVTDNGKRVRYQETAYEFQRLVKRRNDLVHANPATVGDEQRLVRNGMTWQQSDINDLADEFTACSIKLNDLFHHVL